MLLLFTEKCNLKRNKSEIEILLKEISIFGRYLSTTRQILFVEENFILRKSFVIIFYVSSNWLEMLKIIVVAVI